jgi:hypothetical protein
MGESQVVRSALDGHVFIFQKKHPEPVPISPLMMTPSAACLTIIIIQLLGRK